MPEKKLADKNIRKLTRMGRAGSSLGLTLPKELITSLGWKERQKVVVKKISGALVVRDAKSKK
jgi:antitoxin component of MazEF toxin-antitoxin module